MRLCLTHDSSCILSAVDSSIVFTAADIAVLPAAYAADVISDVGIAYHSPVYAVLDRAC